MLKRRVSKLAQKNCRPRTIEDAIRALALVQPSDFNKALARAVNVFEKRPDGKPAYFPWSASLLPECYTLSSAGDPICGLEFKVDPVLAHRVMCVSAFLQRIGWEALDLAAIRWCKNLLRSSLPKDLSEAAARDLLQARIHIISMIREKKTDPSHS